MSQIFATVLDGRVELDAPIDLPNGTRLTIPLPTADRDSHRIGLTEEEWSDSPEAINQWIEWSRSLGPLFATEGEREEFDRVLQARKEWDLAHWAK